MQNPTLFVVLAFVAVIATAEAKCLSRSDLVSECRYEAGDSWCVDHGEGNPYAYSDACLERRRPGSAEGSAQVSDTQRAARTLTAICRNPAGRIYGQDGTLGGNSFVNAEDGIRDGLFTFTWSVGEDTAQIIWQGRTGTPRRETGFVVHTSDEQISLFVHYPAAAWLYSLFPKPGLLLMSKHTNGVGMDSGGAVVTSLMAKCDFSID